MSSSDQPVGVLPAEAAVPPAPPGESPADAVAKVKAVHDALTQLGNEVEPAKLAEHIRASAGVTVDAEEVAAIRRRLLEAPQPPGPDRPPPQEAARRSTERT
jgi:hypothetical protein